MCECMFDINVANDSGGFMNSIILKDKIKIENMIYEIRGKQVMFDSDLAKLYQVETKRINEAVKNNPYKFPERFSWVLTENEWFFLRSKISTLENDIPGKGHYRKYLPRVFTEQGVAMLATILKSKIAVETSIRIMDAFVLLKQYISNNLIEQKYINELVLKDSKRIDLIESVLTEFKEKNNHLFFDGQIYDAYSLLLDILNKAKREIIIIDNYIDKNILDVLSKIDRKILLISNKYNNQDYQKYKKQYNNVELIINNIFHDRFIIIDNSVLYHCGASFKDLGKKCFEISKIEDRDILDEIINKL